MDGLTLVIAQSLINGVLLGGIYLLAAMGLSVVFGVLRIVNLAHGDFVMLGGYAAFVAFSILGLPPLALVPISVTFGIAVGMSIYYGVIDRIRTAGETSWIIVTFGLSATIIGLVRYVFGPTPHVLNLYSGSVLMGPFYFSKSRLIAFAAAIALMLILVYVLQRTRVGKAVRAISQNADLALGMGLPVRGLMAGAFATGSCLAVSAGTLLISVYSIDPEIGHGIVFKSFAILALAGLGRTFATVVIALVLGAGEALLSLWVFQSATELLAFFALLGVILARPSQVLAPRGL